METRTIELSTPDGAMPMYEAVPDEPNGRAVVVVQEAFGVNDHIEDVTRRLATAGYHAVAPHYFHRAGGGTAPYDNFSKVLPLFAGLTDDGILADTDAALGHLADPGYAPEQTATVGFCFGGRVTFLIAARRALGAAVGYYGGGIVTGRPNSPFGPLIGEAASLRTPWLGLFGDQDQSIPVDDVEQLRQALKDAPVDAEVVRYADAGHGFHCDQRPSYHQPSADDAWSRTLTWFDAHL